MTISDDRYFELLRALTDQHEGSDYFTLMGRAWIENQIQIALCDANVFPESSEDWTFLEQADNEQASIDQGIAGYPASLN